MTHFKTTHLAIFILLIANIILSIVYFNTKNKLQAEIASIMPYINKYHVANDNMIHNIEYSAKEIEDVSITDPHGNDFKLSKICDNKKQFIVRISDKYCNTCVEYMLNLINSNTNLNDYQTIYLLSYSNQLLFREKVKEMKIEDKEVYNCAMLESNIDNAGFPYIALVDSNLSIQYCYFPTKGNFITDGDNINMICKYAVTQKPVH